MNSKKRRETYEHQVLEYTTTVFSVTVFLMLSSILDPKEEDEAAEDEDEDEDMARTEHVCFRHLLNGDPTDTKENE